MSNKVGICRKGGWQISNKRKNVLKKAKGLVIVGKETQILTTKR